MQQPWKDRNANLITARRQLNCAALPARTLSSKNATPLYGARRIFGAAMLAIQAYIFFGPLPVSPAAAAVTALVSYVAFAFVAERLERSRALISSCAERIPLPHYSRSTHRSQVEMSRKFKSRCNSCRMSPGREIKILVAFGLMSRYNMGVNPFLSRSC